MSRYHSYLNSAIAILDEYSGDEPFSSFLKKYFSANKKFGSRDRKQVAHLCYCYFRLGKSALHLPTEERILTGLFLCSKENNEILATLKPEWSYKITESTEEKLKDVCINIAAVFPWMEELSREIDYTAFSLSFFVQPDLFLRLRPGKKDTVKQKLSNEGIPFLVLSDNCLALPNTAKVDELLELDRDAVVQDFSSQQTGLFLQSNIQPQKSKISVWDCCAASGGKSIMVKDMLGDIELTVSDVRDSILANLKKRFASAGIKNYKSFVADLTTSSSDLSPFNLIICDAPCSGSGTWGRTPEQLYYFDIEEVNKYAALQKKIAGNALKNLKKGGYFLYITCSVFRKENEEVVDYLLQNFSLNLISMRTIAGYADKADTMFVALMQYN